MKVIILILMIWMPKVNYYHFIHFYKITKIKTVIMVTMRRIIDVDVYKSNIYYTFNLKFN